MSGPYQILTSIVVLGTCKNEEDPTNLQNEGARVLTSLYIDFSDAQGQLTPKSVVEFRQNLNIWLNSVNSFLRYGAKKQQQINESIMCHNSVTNL